MTHRLFIDLDGVLADFDAGAAAVLGMPVQQFQDLHGAALMWRKIEEADGFYENLPWTESGRALWDAVTGAAWTGPHPIVLTGLPLGEWAEPQKRAWCLRELGDHVPVICCMSRDKPMYCCPNDILIDDRDEARLGWRDAGGEFIHYTGSADVGLAALAAVVAT